MNIKVDQKRYKVFTEDGADNVRAELWRYYELHGKFGYIYPYSESELGIQIKSNIISNRVRHMNKWPIIQDADDMTVFKVPNSELVYFAEMLKCRKKRQLTDEQKEKLAKFSEMFRFKVK